MGDDANALFTLTGTVDEQVTTLAVFVDVTFITETTDWVDAQIRPNTNVFVQLRRD